VEPKAALAQIDCPGTYVPLTGRVVDQAEIFNADEEARLVAQLAAFEKRTKHQFVIASVKSLEGRTIEQYSLCHARHWGIGRKKEDDGLVLMIAPNERKVRIEVGIGLESELTDAEAQAIIENAILPPFKLGDFGTGVTAGAAAMMAETGG
jgi:uncharacterized protein